MAFRAHLRVTFFTTSNCMRTDGTLFAHVTAEKIHLVGAHSKLPEGQPKDAAKIRTVPFEDVQ